jgi:hypothetical protein
MQEEHVRFCLGTQSGGFTEPINDSDTFGVRVGVKKEV